MDGDERQGYYLIGVVKCFVNRMYDVKEINMKENQKQNEIFWNVEGRVSLRDFGGKIKVGQRDFVD